MNDGESGQKDWIMLVLFWIFLALFLAAILLGQKGKAQDEGMANYQTIWDIAERYEYVGEVEREELSVLEKEEKMAEVESAQPEPEPTPPAPTPELKILARIIHAESRGEPYEGKLAVGAVIMNRVEASNFPNTIREVVFQPGQFSPVRNGSYYNTPSELSWDAAEAILAGEYSFPSDVLYFYNPDISSCNWIATTRGYRRIGGHMFSRPPE